MNEMKDTEILRTTPWYAQLSTIEPFQPNNPIAVQLIAKLESLRELPAARARLAQFLLLLGFKASALEKLDVSSADPLEQAMLRVVLASSYKYDSVLKDSLDISSINTQAAEEHQILRLYAKGLSLWGQYEYGLAIPTLNLAVDAARKSLPELLWLVEPLLQNTIALATEAAPEQQETQLRQIIEVSKSAIQVLEAKEKLAKLLDVRGNYFEALRVSQTIPGDRFEKGFMYIEAAAAGEFNLINWKALRQRDPIYLPVVQVIQALSMGNYNDILNCPEPPARYARGLKNEFAPDDSSPFHPRSLMTWNIAFSWAYLSIGKLDKALHFLNNASISPSDWDMIYAKNILILSLFALDPSKGREFGNIAQIVAETQRLVERKLYSGTVMMRMTPRVCPYAGAILLAAPGGCPLLEPIAKPLQAILNGRGLELTKILFSVTTSVYKYLIADENPTDAKPSTIRSMRAKLGKILKENGSPHVIRAELILNRLALIAEESKSMPSYSAWLQAVNTYKSNNLL